jgi:hypothetical protein
LSGAVQEDDMTSTYIAPPIVDSLLGPNSPTYLPPAKKNPWRATLSSATVGIVDGTARDAGLWPSA